MADGHVSLTGGTVRRLHRWFQKRPAGLVRAR